MDTTTHRGFAIPSADASDFLDPSLWRTPIQQIDDQMESDQTAIRAACTYGAGFDGASGTNTDPYLVVVGKVVTLNARIKRTSGAGTLAFTVPAGYRPAAVYDNVWLPVTALNGGNTEGPEFAAVLTLDGKVTLTMIDNGKAWDTSTWIHIHGSWVRD